MYVCVCVCVCVCVYVCVCVCVCVCMQLDLRHLGWGITLLVFAGLNIAGNWIWRLVGYY